MNGGKSKVFNYLKLTLNDHTNLEIIVPELKEKYTYYYKPIEDTIPFDEAQFLLKIDNKKILLCTDIIRSILIELKQCLRYALKNQSTVPVNSKGIGYSYNQDRYKDDWDTHNYEPYMLFSNNNVQTFIYNKDGDIYFEVFPLYPELDLEKTNQSSFNAFMNTYQPVMLQKIDTKQIEKWLKKIQILLDTIENNYLKMLNATKKATAQFADFLNKNGIQLHGGRITFADFEINSDSEINMNTSKASTAQITYKKGAGLKYLIHIELVVKEEDRHFLILGIKDHEWEKPIFKKTVSQENFFSELQRCVDIIVRCTTNKP